ncbi:Helix-turn-helix domain-containing protein [Paenibacillus algorifonticola]|uniref:Helix-turn-helix domain-containing protein n=1 Tax=Paenibacillus algorifonticola TaxID=684063 RepID=A0A1I2EXJ6_9BACL|nr:helix-turn-helix domain-containing protein [Paenibacillus algorifonticola]SFE97158.1 Helix-turn-helix domain-containing protein [Paenibacillus algorifonticola]
MSKGRSTNHQERIDIVLYCLAHDHDYRKTAEQYQVSYHQVYQWVKKYMEHGPDALQDITEFRYGSAQKAYLSAILDIHDNTIVSYVLGR